MAFDDIPVSGCTCNIPQARMGVVTVPHACIVQIFCLGRNPKKLTVVIVTGPIPFFKKPSVLTQNINYSLIAMCNTIENASDTTSMTTVFHEKMCFMTKTLVTLDREIQKKALSRTALIPVSTKIKHKTIKLQRLTSKVSDDRLYITNGSEKNGRKNNTKLKKKKTASQARTRRTRRRIRNSPASALCKYRFCMSRCSSWLSCPSSLDP